LGNTTLTNEFLIKDPEVSLKHILDNSRAESGGEKDVKFLEYLIEAKALLFKETVLKRKQPHHNEEYYKERYKKAKYESDRHLICRAVIHEELKEIGISTVSSVNIGDMNILRSNSCYDIASADFSILIDIGYAPARNYFRGLTDLRVKYYMLSPFFDDYMDDIRFSVFMRGSEKRFLDMVGDYE
jgi:hypothetical protein